MINSLLPISYSGLALAPGLLVSLFMLLVGCQPSSTPSTSQTPESLPTLEASPPTPLFPASVPTPSATVEASPTSSPTSQISPIPNSNVAQPLSPPSSAEFVISTDGIGAAKVGMTLGQLKQKLAGKAKFQIKSPFIVDFDAIAITQGGEAQFYILYPAGVPLVDSDIIEALVTNNSKYRTRQGVGPGTLITQAETAYGKATLSHNVMNESREYVKFANLPTKAIAFRTQAPADTEFAGIYPASKEELKETQNFQKTAVIGLVEVYCRENCPLPSP